MKITVENGEIVIRAPYDPKGTYPPSKTGKTLIIASSGGFMPVPGAEGVKINIAITRTKP